MAIVAMVAIVAIVATVRGLSSQDFESLMSSQGNS